MSLFHLIVLLALLSLAQCGGKDGKIAEIDEQSDMLENEIREFYQRNAAEFHDVEYRLQGGLKDGGKVKMEVKNAQESEKESGVMTKWLNCTPMYPHVRVVAHRGANYSPGLFAPENTLLAIYEAYRLGASVVEVDVRHTKDDQYILMHDDTLDRTTNGTGRVEDYTLSEIQALVVDTILNQAGPQPIPTLKEALEYTHRLGMSMDIDMKTDRVEGAVQVVVSTGLESSAIVYGGVDKLVRSRSVSMEVPIMASSDGLDDTRALLQILNPPPAIIHLQNGALTVPHVEYIHDNQMLAWMNTLGARDVIAVLGYKEPIRRFMEKGVDLIQTDLPGLVAEYRDSFCVDEN
jgi:glycerophosphoryl diester phosphodiesterase